MSENETPRTSQQETPKEKGTEGVAWPGPCGGMGRMMQTCPCATWFSRYRPAAYTALIVAGLGLLALSVGWILGVFAFLRTL